MHHCHVINIKGRSYRLRELGMVPYYVMSKELFVAHNDGMFALRRDESMYSPLIQFPFGRVDDDIFPYVMQFVFK